MSPLLLQRLLKCLYYTICFLVILISNYSCKSFTIISSSLTTTTRRISTPSTLIPLQQQQEQRQRRQRRRYSIIVLNVVSKRRTAIFDGSEWLSIQKCLAEENEGKKKYPFTDYGSINVIAGTTSESNERVVGIEGPNKKKGDEGEDDKELISLDDNNGVNIYKDSMAIIPQKVGFDDAITTLIASYSSIHCALPNREVTGIGGSDDEFVNDDIYNNMKAVVMGGSNYAKFIAEGLATIIETSQNTNNKSGVNNGDSKGASSSVSLVTTRNNIRVNHKMVNVIGPAIASGDDSQEGFASHIGEFDVLVDTMSDESKGMKPRAVVAAEEDDDDDDDDLALLFDSIGSGLVLRELQRQNKCSRYVSTFTKSQRIAKDKGVIFGPGNVDKYHNDIISRIKQSTEATKTRVPKGFSKTIQTLLDNNILFKSNDYKIKNDMSIRNWNLQDFWELASWPRDSSGGSSVRFGLPVLEEEDDEEEYMSIDEPMIQAQRLLQEENEQEDEQSRRQSQQYVTNIFDVNDLTTKIINPGKDSILFLSSKYCRTCKYLEPKYIRMAKQNSEEEEDLMFAKSTIGSDKGKALRSVLKVNSVPTFILYKNGERYGEPISISKIPSKKLNLALEYLQSNKEWDSSIML